MKGLGENGAAAIEAALLMPVFLTLAVGTVDFGTAMFQSMQVNAAAQAGMASGVIDPTLSGVTAAMNSAAGNLTLDNALSASSISNGVVTVTATCDTAQGHSCAPILPWPMAATYARTGFPAHLSATLTVRIF
jgi:Flp pilus assembly protein TadG